MKRALPFVIIIVVLVAALSMMRFFGGSPTVSPRTGSPSTPLTKSPTGAAKLGADPPHALGKQDAPVLLEEFGDFQCTPCGMLHPVLKTLKADFGEQLTVVFRQFPLASAHAHALEAAQAAEAAGRQGKFWEMHDLLYRNQASWKDASDVKPIFLEYATTIGLDLAQFRADVTSSNGEQRIGLDKERGYWIGVNSTPTVFLNGREVPPDALTEDKLRALISEQLRAR